MCYGVHKGYRICDQIKYIRARSKHDGSYHPMFVDIHAMVEATDCTIMTAVYALEATNGNYKEALILIKEAVEHSLGGSYEDS